MDGFFFTIKESQANYFPVSSPKLDFPAAGSSVMFAVQGMGVVSVFSFNSWQKENKHITQNVELFLNLCTVLDSMNAKQIHNTVSYIFSALIHMCYMPIYVIILWIIT